MHVVVDAVVVVGGFVVRSSLAAAAMLLFLAVFGDAGVDRAADVIVKSC